MNLKPLEYMRRQRAEIVDEIGFCVHDSHPFIAVSPDGLIKVDGKYKGAVEVKCPSSKKHIEYMRIGRVPNGVQIPSDSLLRGQ